MSVSFNEIPAGTLVPYTYIEFDSSRAMARSQGVQPYRVLLVGQKLKDGSQPSFVPVRIASEAEASERFGTGSMLHSMVAAAFQNHRDVETWAIAVDDPDVGTRAQAMVTIEGTVEGRGVFAGYVGGRPYRFPIADLSLADVAKSIAAIIMNDPLRHADAEVHENKVTITARHAGEVGNAIDLRLNYFMGESTPRGLKVKAELTVPGTGNPDIARVIKAAASEQWNVIASPHTDEPGLTAWDKDLEDRWGPLRQTDGHLFTASNLGGEELSNRFKAMNSKHITIMAATDSPSPVWEWAAATASVNAFEAQTDPARPYQTLALKGILAPKKIMGLAERDLRLKDGIATTTVDPSGTIRIERLVTTYKRSPAGALDRAYFDLNTKQTLSLLRWDFRNHFMTKFARHKLADDGTRFGAGQAILTPKTAKAEALSKFAEWEERGLVENADQFRKEMIVERNRQNPNRLDFMLPPDLINQLMITAVQIGFVV